MAAKTQTPLDFLVARLRANPKADYASLKAAAEKRKLEVWPVMFGRAKALLGLVPMAKRGQGKSTKATTARKPGRRGRPVSADSKSARIRELLKAGASAADIANQVGASVNLVYGVRHRMGATAKRGPGRPLKATLSVRRGPGRPRKAAGLDRLGGLVTAIREQRREAQQLRSRRRRSGSWSRGRGAGEVKAAMLSARAPAATLEEPVGAPDKCGNQMS